MRNLLIAAALLAPLTARAYDRYNDLNWAAPILAAMPMVPVPTTVAVPAQADDCVKAPDVKMDYPKNRLTKDGALINGTEMVLTWKVTACSGEVVWLAHSGMLYKDARPIGRAMSYHADDYGNITWYDGAGEHHSR